MSPPAYSRLYSVVIVGLAVTAVLDFVGARLNDSFYNGEKTPWDSPNLVGYVAGALFVNEFQVFGFKGASPGTNGPYWSLSFEAAYYIAAGLFLFLRRHMVSEARGPS